MAGYDDFFNKDSGVARVATTWAAQNVQQREGILGNFDRLRREVYHQYLVDLVEDDRYYRLDFGKNLIPKEWDDRGFKPTLPPTAYNAVEAASDTILTTPEIFVPVRPTKDNFGYEREVASSKKAALEFFWHNVFLAGDPVGKGKKKLIKDGKIVLKKEIDWDKVDDDTVSVGYRGFPYKVRLLSNETVYEDPDHPEDPWFCYESYEIRVSAAIRLFPEVKAYLSTRRDGDKVRLVEYWSKPRGTSKGKRCVYIDDVKVLDKANPYRWVSGLTASGKELYDGYIPYFIADSGWGDVDADSAPHQRYVGMIRYIRSVIETEARQLTAADAQLRIATFPVTILKGISEDDEHPITLGPATKIHMPAGDDASITTLSWPDVPAGVWNILQRLHGYANELAKFESLGGQAPRGVSTATESQQVFQSASAKLAGPMSGLRSLFTRINRSILQDIELVIEGPVTLYGAIEGSSGVTTLNPEDIDGFYDTFVELKTSDQAQLNRANMMMWANLYQVFNLDREYAMAQAGIKNPAERIANRATEDVFFDPRQHELRVAMSMAGQGELGQIIQQRMMATMGNPEGQPPPGGAPAGANFPGMDNAPSAPRGETGEDLRASAFAQALDSQPDAAYR